MQTTFYQPDTLQRKEGQPRHLYYPGMSFWSVLQTPEEVMALVYSLNTKVSREQALAEALKKAVERWKNVNIDAMVDIDTTSFYSFEALVLGKVDIEKLQTKKADRSMPTISVHLPGVIQACKVLPHCDARTEVLKARSLNNQNE